MIECGSCLNSGSVTVPGLCQQSLHPSSRGYTKQVSVAGISSTGDLFPIDSPKSALTPPWESYVPLLSLSSLVGVWEQKEEADVEWFGGTSLLLNLWFQKLLQDPEPMFAEC